MRTRLTAPFSVSLALAGSVLAIVGACGTDPNASSESEAQQVVRPIPPIQLPNPETRLGLSLTSPVLRGAVRSVGKSKPIAYQKLDEKFGVIEGDILVPLNRIRATLDDFEENVDPNNPTGFDVYSRWPGGIVPYKIDAGLPNQARVSDAIAHWQSTTSIRFIPANGSHKDYILFRKGGGCSSSIGMITGEQYVNLADDCSKGNTIHEIGHAVGLWHEHTRFDRDSFVDIFLANVTAGKEHNFQSKAERGFNGEDIGSYDYGSIMHYGSYFFSKNGQPTILRDNGTEIVAQRTALSAGDLAQVRGLYEKYVQGDCIGFNPATIQVKQINGDWKIVDGNHWMYSFGSNQAEAQKSFQILKAYAGNQSCYVGRPGPSMHYFLKSGIAPTGNLVAGEDCIGFNNANVNVEALNNGQQYRIVADGSILMDFGNNRYEAHRAYRVIKDLQLSKQCFVGRPGPSFTYWKK